MNVTDILATTARVEDQILIGLVRVSQSTAVLTRLIDAAKATATGPQEIAILDGLSLVGSKLMEILGTR
jgi:hypothetical protein